MNSARVQLNSLNEFSQRSVKQRMYEFSQTSTKQQLNEFSENSVKQYLQTTVICIQSNSGEINVVKIQSNSGEINVVKIQSNSACMYMNYLKFKGPWNLLKHLNKHHTKRLPKDPHKNEKFNFLFKKYIMDKPDKYTYRKTAHKSCTCTDINTSCFPNS